jgi:DNA repair photolyase
VDAQHPLFRWQLAEEEQLPPQLFADGQLVDRHVGAGEYRGYEFLEVRAKRLINRLPASGRLPFSHTVNAYRGCSHACSYCFARPTHSYLGLDIGRDFERRIVVKINAVERLRAELASRRWRGETIAMGTNTDPYQHAEARYHLTRGLVEVLTEARNPFSLLTKSTLILRDLELLRAALERCQVSVNFSIGTLDREVWRLTEPGTPPPDRRVEAVRRLNAAGIPCGVLIAPVLPGLSDDAAHLEAVATACLEAGATSIRPIALHLRSGVDAHFLAALDRGRPDLSELYRERFARGPYQSAPEQQRIADTVEAVTGRREDAPAPPTPSLPSSRAVQLGLFSASA